VRWWEAGLPGNDDQDHEPDGEQDPQPSIMRLLLTDDEAERLEIAPGQWYLPGTPP